ncbi:hypothetical protein N7539_002284 [Penicillium diatomitis]|uniref:FAD-binding FR-type domain-containing protein n=1 Tax=Penicillium diatomitis TaxID=2819901 RepID=A0A9W9XFN3_9EURO|nr:uncharacterized protein N7539_002284 [Penicillium diatomitis]KAJ5490717.1 hypothetical protein N7539_002284 [Penicillium diatomitis]
MAYDAEADVVKLNFEVPRALETKPGDYYFLHQPLRAKGWENHPFTVCSWGPGSTPHEDESLTPSRSHRFRSDSQLPLLITTVSQNLGHEWGLDDGHILETTRLTFWIRPYDGWTRQLRRQCLRDQKSPSTPFILLEGPYGHSLPLWDYDSVLMVVGGTGIAAALPYLQDHLRRSLNHRSADSKQKLRTKSVELIWVAKQATFQQDVVNRDLQPFLHRDDFRASLYCTDTDYRVLTEDQNRITMSAGRPSISSVISDRATDPLIAGLRIAIFVCGPVQMCDEARMATRAAMEHGHKDLQYFEDSFTW